MALTLSLLLSACSDNKKAQAEQLAQMQAKIEEQERQNAQMQQAAERARQEEELRKAKEEAKLELEAELEAKRTKEQVTSPQTNANPSKKPDDKPKAIKKSTAQPALKEKLVRYPATVITASGYGELSLRGEPSTKGVQVATVSDGDEVYVIAETNQCETINKMEGCWFKVDAHDMKGYMFGGYLQREMLSQAEKDYLFYQEADISDDEYSYEDNY